MLNFGKAKGTRRAKASCSGRRFYGIDPLFLDDLKAQLREIKATAVERIKKRRLEEFQRKLAGLVFLDPAAGSGNFLTDII